MNEREFKQHLKDLAHGHHHPEEHDWNGASNVPKKTVAKKARVAPKRTKKGHS
jgi:hypothetical protein